MRYRAIFVDVLDREAEPSWIAGVTHVITSGPTLRPKVVGAPRVFLPASDH